MSVTGAAEAAEEADLMVLNLSVVAGESYQVAAGRMQASGRMQTPGSGRSYLAVAQQTASVGWVDLVAAW